MAVETSVEKEILGGKERRTPPHRAERKREREKRTRRKTWWRRGCRNRGGRVKAKRRNALGIVVYEEERRFQKRGVSADAKWKKLR